MPLDTSIAMGVRPVEQPNMLAQMGQMMALRQAQQGYEEQNALKQALSQGVDINDKATFNRLASINPKLAMDLRAKELESQKTNAEIGLKRADYLGGAYGDLVKNPTLDNARGILSNAVSLGILTPQHAEQQFATLSADPSKIAELAQKGVLASISAKEKMADATSRANNAATVGASYYGHNVSAANNIRTNEAAMARHLNPTPQILTGENGFYTVNPRDPNSAQPVGMAPPPPQIQPSITNALANPATASTIATPPVNSLIPTVQSQPGAPIAANAPVTQLRPPAKNIQTTEITDPDNPMQSLRVNANTYTGKGVNDPGYIGVVKTGNLNPAQQQKLKTEMAKDYKTVENVMSQTDEILKSIDAVRNSNLEGISGPIAGRTPTISKDLLLAETRLENLKGKVTALGKASASMSGAIGSIANQEWQILANQIAVIDLTKGDKAINEQIDRIESQAIGTANRMREGFERQYGEHIDTLGPQYKTIPSVTYKPGSAGYTRSGQTASGVDRSNPLLK
jgi:hypothetical protein